MPVTHHDGTLATVLKVEVTVSVSLAATNEDAS